MVCERDDAILQIKSGQLCYYSMRSSQTFCLARKSTVRLLSNIQKICRAPSHFRDDFVPVFGQNGPMLWLGCMGSIVDIVYIGANTTLLYEIRSMSCMIPTLRFSSCATPLRLITNYRMQDMAVIVLGPDERSNSEEIRKFRQIQCIMGKPQPVIIKIASAVYFDEKRENSSDVDAQLAPNVVKNEFYSLLLQGIILYFNRGSISALTRPML